MTTPTWIADLPADVLRHLASIAAEYERPRFIDPERAAEELADMVTRGTCPTIGWFRRNLVRGGGVLV